MKLSEQPKAKEKDFHTDYGIVNAELLNHSLTENENTRDYLSDSEPTGKCSGIMGVPITFLERYNPEQFEIIDINPHFFCSTSKGLAKPKQLTLKKYGKKDPYARILIKKKVQK